MIKVKFATWKKDRREIVKIRKTVFVKEQNVPEELDFDGLDENCSHVLAFVESQIPIGTARMLPDGHIGRVAVLKKWRGLGVGKSLVKKLMEKAARLGLLEVYLNSQESAIGFYEKIGFRKKGKLFYEAGIPHLQMRKAIEKK